MNNWMILTGDALAQLRRLNTNCIDCCITSPPYYGLRDYGIDGQIGLEASPEEYIDRLVCVFREVWRVLKDDGTLWVNIADSYAGSGKGVWQNRKKSKETYVIAPHSAAAKMPKIFDGIKAKDLIGIPWMLAFALRADGWYLRQDIIWQKPNAMPESVRDRCTKSHEYIFMLSKCKHYYYDADAIKEPCVGFDTSYIRGSKGSLTPNSGRRKGNNRSFRGGGVYTGNRSFDNSADRKKETVGNVPNETGMRNKRDVWSVSTHGFADAHFATFPPALIEPCVLAGSRRGGIVLDPFAGTATTGEVAIKNGRGFIGIELNPFYVDMGARRMESIQK